MQAGRRLALPGQSNCRGKLQPLSQGRGRWRALLVGLCCSVLVQRRLAAALRLRAQAALRRRAAGLAQQRFLLRSLPRHLLLPLLGSELQAVHVGQRLHALRQLRQGAGNRVREARSGERCEPCRRRGISAGIVTSEQAQGCNTTVQLDSWSHQHIQVTTQHTYAARECKARAHVC